MLSYTIDPQRRLVTTTSKGEVTTAQVAAYQDALAADPAFDPSYALAFDGREGNFAGIAAPEVRQVAERTPFAPTALRAFIASRDIDFALFRMFQAYSELTGRGDCVQVFREVDAALAWIEQRQAPRR